MSRGGCSNFLKRYFSSCMRTFGREHLTWSFNLKRSFCGKGYLETTAPAGTLSTEALVFCPDTCGSGISFWGCWSTVPQLCNLWDRNSVSHSSGGREYEVKVWLVGCLLKPLTGAEHSMGIWSSQGSGGTLWSLSLSLSMISAFMFPLCYPRHGSVSQPPHFVTISLILG